MYVCFLLVTELLMGNLSSYVIRHEESLLWVIDNERNELLELDIESIRGQQKNKHNNIPRLVIRVL